MSYRKVLHTTFLVLISICFMPLFLSGCHYSDQFPLEQWLPNYDEYIDANEGNDSLRVNVTGLNPIAFFMAKGSWRYVVEGAITEANINKSKYRKGLLIKSYTTGKFITGNHYLTVYYDHCLDTRTFYIKDVKLVRNKANTGG